jgi:hypothetical protein
LESLLSLNAVPKPFYQDGADGLPSMGAHLYFVSFVSSQVVPYQPLDFHGDQRRPYASLLTKFKNNLGSGGYESEFRDKL